jgi:hypothetical protein
VRPRELTSREARIDMLMHRARGLATDGRTVSIQRMRNAFGDLAEDDQELVIALARLIERDELVRVEPGRYGLKPRPPTPRRSAKAKG